MKPGEFIEWSYRDRSLVPHSEKLWSTLEDRWIPIGLTSLLVWVTDTEYAWLTPKGVVPRTQG